MSTPLTPHVVHATEPDPQALEARRLLRRIDKELQARAEAQSYRAHLQRIRKDIAVKARLAKAMSERP